MTTDELVQLDRHSVEIVVATLNRPEKRNALSGALLRDLSSTIEQLEREAIARVLIVRGAGPAFCAGMDLVEAGDARMASSSLAALRRVFEQLRDSPMVTIAAAHGAAYGGGAGLIAACDLAIASDDLRLAFPETRRGLVPALVSVLLAAKVREGDLRELLLVGDAMTAQRGQEMGLVQEVTSAEQFMRRTLGIAETIALGGPEAVRLTKRLLNRRSLASDFDHAQRLFEQVREGAEAREGLEAFQQGRRPSWIVKPN